MADREPLPHNASSGVTQDIWREERDGAPAVVKRLGRKTDGVPDHWLASDDPRHWNFWEREALVYETDLPGRLGVGAPGLVAVDRHDDGTIDVVLEAVEGRTGAQLGLEDVAAAAFSLGVAQGRTDQPSDPWLSRGYLRAYTTSKPWDREILWDDAKWRLPLIERHLDGLAAPLQELHAERDWYFDVVERCPRTTCHLDTWMNNVIARPGGDVLLIDWAFVGDGAIGEDASNLVIDSVMDVLWPPERLGELDDAVFAAYRAGLREAGWRGDDRVVRLAMCASAVKYEWLGGFVLERAEGPNHSAYGTEVDAETLFASRGAGLRLVADYAAEARRLSGTRG